MITTIIQLAMLIVIALLTMEIKVSAAGYVKTESSRLSVAIRLFGLRILRADLLLMPKFSLLVNGNELKSKNHVKRKSRRKISLPRLMKAIDLKDFVFAALLGMSTPFKTAMSVPLVEGAAHMVGNLSEKKSITVYPSFKRDESNFAGRVEIETSIFRVASALV
ncbi:MAG: hypothetical protein GX891_05450 [Clostridiales bacterium]|nr:hypothetical protein [Clostridiales bacterium]